jgi:hypothetical protein
MKTYFNLYDFSLQYKSGHKCGGGGNRACGWGLQPIFFF